MVNTSAIRNLKEVRGTVVGNTAGALLEAFEEPDGEAVAAVTGFATHRLSEAGAQLGLGTLANLTTTGGQGAFLVAIQDDTVVSVRVDPTASMNPLETKVRDALSDRGLGW